MKFFDWCSTGKMFWVTLTIVYGFLGMTIADLFSVIATGTHLWVWWLM